MGQKGQNLNMGRIVLGNPIRFRSRQLSKLLFSRSWSTKLFRTRSNTFHSFFFYPFFEISIEPTYQMLCICLILLYIWTKFFWSYRIRFIKLSNDKLDFLDTFQWRKLRQNCYRWKLDWLRFPKLVFVSSGKSNSSVIKTADWTLPSQWSISFGSEVTQ